MMILTFLLALIGVQLVAQMFPHISEGMTGKNAPPPSHMTFDPKNPEKYIDIGMPPQHFVEEKDPYPHYFH